MGRLAVVNFLSIDGVIQAPLSAEEDTEQGFAHGGWVVPYSDETVAGFMRDATVNAGGLLLGRKSYDIFADTWSGADEREPAVAAMNRMAKFVVSCSPGPLAWANTQRMDGDLPSAVRELKDRVDGDIVVFGSATLVQGLASHDLIDEYRLLLFPLVIGRGKRMFGQDSPFTRLVLTDITTSPSGVVMMTYNRTTGPEPQPQQEQTLR